MAKTGPEKSYKVDFSKNTAGDNSTTDLNKLGLDANQLKELKKYLNQKNAEKQNEEKLGIIYLTQNELKELKGIFTDANTNNNAQLSEFLTKQSEETITTSEVIKGTKLDSILNGIDIGSALASMENVIYEQMKNILPPDISEDARRNLITGFNMYVLKVIGDLDKDKILDFLPKISKQINDEKGSFNITSLMGDINKLNPDFKIDIPNIFIAFNSFKTLNGNFLKEGGELNKIFMDPNKGITFFEGVVNGNITDIGEELNKDENNVAKKGDIKHDIDSLRELANDVGENLPTKIDYIKNKVLEQTGLLQTLSKMKDTPVIGGIIKFIMGLLGFDSIDEALSESIFNKAKQSFVELVSKKDNGTILNGFKIGNDFMMKDGNKDTEFLKNLQSITGKEKITKKTLLSLLKKDGKLDKFNNSLKPSKLVLKNNDNTIDYENLSDLISQYKTHLEDKKKPATKVVAASKTTTAKSTTTATNTSATK